jgi:hypothetical protein
MEEIDHTNETGNALRVLRRGKIPNSYSARYIYSYSSRRNQMSQKGEMTGGEIRLSRVDSQPRGLEARKNLTKVDYMFVKGGAKND